MASTSTDLSVNNKINLPSIIQLNIYLKTIRKDVEGVCGSQITLHDLYVFDSKTFFFLLFLIISFEICKRFANFTQIQTQNPNTQKIENPIPIPNLNLWVFFGCICLLMMSSFKLRNMIKYQQRKRENLYQLICINK